MPDRLKRAFYVKYVSDACYIDILAKRPDVRLDKLENESPDSAAAPILEAAHAYQVSSARDELATKFHVTKALLARMPNLLIVSTNGAGYDTVNVKDCSAAGILVVNQSGGNREAVAQHVLGMLLCLSKRIIETDRALRRGTLGHRDNFRGRETQGRTIGIVGIGNVGRRVAELTRGLLGMQVLAYDPYLTEQEIAARGARKVELDELLRRSEFVSINCPLTEETHRMIGARELALMPKNAILIATARGFIHDEQALLEALRSGHVAAAGLDVWDKEPPPPDHPLLQLDNVLASPHTAGLTPEARTTMGRIAAEQMLACLDGKRPVRLINPEAWPLYAQRFERALGFAPESGAAERVAASA
jgi:D-3-phosphoglycerate dehydrogenase